ncbi:Chromobox protein-like 6 [Exaiptasia diaphana]|nr:Chromobox protein-like 6 [Exaiptasia diaphana]
MLYHRVDFSWTDILYRVPVNERPIDPPEEDNEDEPYLDYSDIPSSSFIDSSLESTDTMDIQQDIVDNSNPDIESPPRELETRQDTDKVEDTTSPIDNVNVFAAEKIVKKRTRKGKVEYLVKWANHPSSDNTWEPSENILDSRLIEIFERK